jgi:hypothetical protein
MQVTAHGRGFGHPQSYAEQALAAGPDNSDLQLRMVEALWWRVADGSVAVPAEDLRRAEDLATAAWQQQRRWSGSSGQVLTVLLRKNLLAGAYTTMSSLATPMPQGQASEQEVGEDSVAYLGSVAAFALGDGRTLVILLRRRSGLGAVSLNGYITLQMQHS